MKTIEQLAREAEATPYTNRHYPDHPFFTFSPEQLQRFHDLAIAQYRESLLAGVGEPQKIEQTDQYGDAYGYTADQLIAAVLRERERCAKVCERGEYAIDGGGNHYYRPADARWCAKAIRGQR